MPTAKRKSPPITTPDPSQRSRRSRSGRSNPVSRSASQPTPSPGSPATQSAASAPSPADNGSVIPAGPVVVNGKYLVDAFKHVTECVPAYRDKWFTAEDWLGTLPTYWPELKKHKEKLAKTRMFTSAMNSNLGGDLVLHKYDEGNKFGVYSNKYEFTYTNKEGERKRTKTTCYLFTQKNNPCPARPPARGFTPYNLKEIRVGRRTEEAATSQPANPNANDQCSNHNANDRSTPNDQGNLNPNEIDHANLNPSTVLQLSPLREFCTQT